MATRNPKDSMTSTWRQGNRAQWNFNHWSIELLAMHQSDLDKETPVHKKTDKVPVVSSWSLHRSVLLHALVPLALHQLYSMYTGRNFSPLQNTLFYSLAFNVAANHYFQTFRRLGHQYGHFDGDVKPRDGVPDVGVAKAVTPLVITTFVRPLSLTLFAYKATESPLHDLRALLWIPLEASLYGIVLDFWYYWLHRATHEVDFLWKYHRTHHLTKHPTALMTIYTDTVQEVFDVAGSPLVTWASMKLLGFPFSFYSWWFCLMYVLHAELAGHSGLRLLYIAPSPASWLLKLLDAELVIEDHDLHHRYGWRQAANYGKQTRLWDKLFGTVKERIECVPSNLDWENTVDWPLF